MSNTVLVANRDLVTLKAIDRLLSREHTVVCTQQGRDALTIATEQEIAAAIIDTELSDMNGLDLLRVLRPHERGIPCLFISRFGHTASRLEAIRLGVTNWIEQPLTAEVLLRAMRQTLVDRPVGNDIAHERHSLIRWATIVVRLIELPYDVRTLEEWARSVAVSVGALRNWCRTANLPARRSLLFARTLRAVIRYSALGLPPAQLLNVVDRRTLSKMLIDAGGTSIDLPPDAQAFLTRQRYVSDVDALNLVRVAIKQASFSRLPVGDGAESGHPPTARSKTGGAH
jgi:DNA-binding response OmpR family regulator